MPTRARRWLGGIVAFVIAITTVLAAPTPAEAVEVIDVNQPAQGQGRFSSQLGQPFTVGVDGKLVAVAFAGTYSPSVPHRVYAADADGKPTGPVLASVSARVGTTARLSTPLAVRSGERYVATVTLGSVANALMSTSTTGQAGLQGTSSTQPTWTPLASPFAFSTIVESAPPVPTNVTVALEGGDFVVRWDAAPRATSYEVTWGSDPSQSQSTTETTLRFTAAPREARTFQVRAFDGSGDAGAWSAGKSLQAGELPFVPTSAVQVLSQRGVEVSWQVPRDNPFGSYQPTYSVWRSDTTAGSAPVEIATHDYIPDGYSPDASSFWYVDEGATPGHRYEYQVRSANAMGEVFGQVLPLHYVDTPGAPGLVLEAGAQSFSVASLTSSPNGGTISATEYSMRVAGTTAAWVTTPPVKFLQNGTEYQVHARQQNEYGWGPWSDWVSVVPVGTANAPHSLSATPGNGTLALSWSVDGVENGAEIASAHVRYREKGASAWTEVEADSLTSTTLTGLDPGVDIEWQVRAQDVAGRPGEWSSVRTDSPHVTATAPLDLFVEPAAEELVVSWSPPTDLGGLPVEHYQARIESPGAEPREVSVTDGRSVTIAALPGVLSTVSVWAVTGAGAGARVSGAAAAYTTPSAPVVDSATPSAGALQVAWTAGSDGGSSVLRWEVRVSTTSMIQDVSIDDPAAREALITGLDDGEELSVTVRAENAAGWGPWSTASAAMSGVAPSAPAILDIDEADGELIVRWTGSTGSPSPTYTIVASAGSTKRVFTADAGAVQQSLTGLSNGTAYAVTVTASNPLGDASSLAVIATPVGLATPPQTLGGSSADRALEVWWSPPASAGGTPVTGYLIELLRGGQVVETRTVTETSARFDGLTNGLEVEVSVRALTAAGEGESASIALTPFLFQPTVRDSAGREIATLTVGQAFTITDEALPRDATISAELHSTPVALGSAGIGPDGRARLDALVPSSTSAGDHEVVVTLTVPGQSPVTVTLPVRVDAAPGTGALAVSGPASASAMLFAAILAFLLGGSLLRRRRGA